MYGMSVKNPLLMTKLRNRVNAIDPSLNVHLSNISINGVKQGCSGFVGNPANGKIVYICTDQNHGLSQRALYRTAKNLRDYAGGQNNFAEFDDVAAAAVKLLY